MSSSSSSWTPTTPMNQRGHSMPRMRRRGSSTATYRSTTPDYEAPSTSSFSSYEPLTCPICDTKLVTACTTIFDEHVEHCTMRRTIALSSTTSFRRRSGSSSAGSDVFSGTGAPSEIGTVDDHTHPAVHIARHEYDDARYTISGTGGALEFGGFGLGDPLAPEDALSASYYISRPGVPKRNKMLLGRAALRRRLAVDLDPFGALAAS